MPVRLARILRGRGTGVRQPASRSRRVLGMHIAGWLSVVVALALVAGSLGVYLKYRAVWNSIHRVAITSRELGKRPPRYTSAINLLVFGSDSRAGLTFHQQVLLHVGRTGCGCSDTIMVVHISPGRRHVTVLNLPRDTMIPEYQCAAGPGMPGQQGYPGALEQINFTLQRGGPACLWKTIEHVTGIRLDHFIEIQFTGVVKVINDVGGVNVCVPFTINDPNSGLVIAKGKRHITGLKFLEYWRARYSLADGTDLKRIQRDDLLLAEVLREVLHDGLLSSPPRLVSVVSDAASAMTTDAGLTQSDLLHIASSFRGLSSNDVQFIEAPTVPYPPAPSQVEFAQPPDDRLFAAIARDSKLPSAARAVAPGRHGTPPALYASPAQVKVQVLNGSGVTGIAGQVAAELSRRGFDVVGTSDATYPSGAPDFSYTTPVIEYGSAADLPAVHTLSGQLSSVVVRQVSSLAPGTIDLIIGSRFSTLAPVPSASHPGPSGPAVGSLAKDYGGITGNATCKTVIRAFTGPNNPAG